VTLFDAGMPEISENERAFFRSAVGRTHARIGASVRMREDAVQLALDAGCDELFIICPTSPVHRTVRLQLSLDEQRARLERVVRLGARAGKTINLVAEDSARAPLDDLIALALTALEAGATRIMLCDTVGVLTPSRMAQQVRATSEALPGVPLGVHCHNDFGMATANTIAAIEAGVDFPTVCVNGIGERSGNASLAEIVLASERLLGRPTGIDPLRLPALASEVERLTGLVISPHQPVVGFNAYRHESGTHVDGLLKGAETYEPIPPFVVGRERRLVVGKHTGRAHLRHVASGLGIELGDAAIDRLLSLVHARGPGDRRERFDSLRAALHAFELESLGVPEAELEEMIRAVASEVA
jgi:isopropylmalate/homocitrate/citramalate synthase